MGATHCFDSDYRWVDRNVLDARLRCPLARKREQASLERGIPKSHGRGVAGKRMGNDIWL
jgi:hypothetical protein